MSDRFLSDILKIIHRAPVSQAELCKKLNISKSQIHKFVSNLITPGYVVKQESSDYLQESGRPRQYLHIAENQPYYTALLIHTNWLSRLYLYQYGKRAPLCSADLKHSYTTEELKVEIDAAVSEVCSNNSLSRSSVYSLVIATQGTVEQGEHGIMYRNNVLTDEGIPFADIVAKKIGIRTFVYNYAYAHMLRLLHSVSLNTEYAMAILCGEGSVALGIFSGNQIMLGRNNSLPECSHLPYRYGLEKSLGSYGRHTEDALFFCISSIAPVYNINHVIIAGSCFDGHLDSIYKVGRSLKQVNDPLLRNLTLEYRGKDIEDFMEELVFLAFDTLVDVISPVMQKKSLEELVINSDMNNI